jgi:hypothetical protein
MCVCPVFTNYLSVVRKHQALVDLAALSLLQQRIDSHPSVGLRANFITHFITHFITRLMVLVSLGCCVHDY